MEVQNVCSHCAGTYDLQQSGSSRNFCSAACLASGSSRVSFAARKKKGALTTELPPTSTLSRGAAAIKIARMHNSLNERGIPNIVIGKHVTADGTAWMYSEGGSDEAEIMRFLHVFAETSAVGRDLRALALEAAAGGSVGFITTLDAFLARLGTGPGASATGSTVIADTSGTTGEAAAEGTSEDATGTTGGSLQVCECSRALYLLYFDHDLLTPPPDTEK